MSMKPMRVKAVIFDLDGTLASFNLDYKTVRAEVKGYLVKMGVPDSILSVNESIFEMLRKTEIFMKDSGKPLKFLRKIRSQALTMSEKYELEAAKRTNLFPGAVEALKALRRMSLKIGLCTINSEISMNHILKRFEIADFFDVTVPRNKVNHFKPHPEHLETALRALGASAKSTVVVGDSVTDMQSASALKAIAVGLPTGVSTMEQLRSNGANYIMTSITDLPLLIERINKAQEGKRGQK
jgi:HAD superfamily hydrolase (TIGR01509 family)